MARLWDAQHSVQIDDETIAATQAVAIANPVWTIDDIKSEIGYSDRHANRALAQKLLEYKGLEVNKKTIDSQMKSLQRWEAYQTGSSSQKAKPSKANQNILNDIGRQAAGRTKGGKVKMKGTISVNGYQRDGRKADVMLDDEQMREFIENPSYEALAAAYGTKELHAYDADIEVEWNE